MTSGRWIPFSAVRPGILFTGMAMLLSGCATPPVVSSPDLRPVEVSCTSDQLAAEPCAAQARRVCSSPQLRDAHLQAATPYTTGVGPHTEQLYQYQATYMCPRT
jgi:hypothetical protein